MFVTAESATVLVRLDGHFDSAQARSLEQMLSTLEPIRKVVVDFAAVRDPDAAAVASLARTLGAAPGVRVTLRGLSRHLRRVLRYVDVGAAALVGSEPDAGLVAG